MLFQTPNIYVQRKGANPKMYQSVWRYCFFSLRFRDVAHSDVGIGWGTEILLSLFHNIWLEEQETILCSLEVRISMHRTSTHLRNMSWPFSTHVLLLVHGYDRAPALWTTSSHYTRRHFMIDLYFLFSYYVRAVFYMHP